MPIGADLLLTIGSVGLIVLIWHWTRAEPILLGRTGRRERVTLLWAASLSLGVSTYWLTMDQHLLRPWPKTIEVAGLCLWFLAWLAAFGSVFVALRTKPLSGDAAHAGSPWSASIVSWLITGYRRVTRTSEQRLVWWFLTAAKAFASVRAFDSELAIYSDMIARWHLAADTYIQVELAWAINNRAYVLGRLGLPSVAAQELQNLISQLGANEAFADVIDQAKANLAALSLTN